jgi:hypothetical protein
MIMQWIAREGPNDVGSGLERGHGFSHFVNLSGIVMKSRSNRLAVEYKLVLGKPLSSRAIATWIVVTLSTFIGVGYDGMKAHSRITVAIVIG